MRTNKFAKLLLFICCTLTFAACDDEDGIYFTQDEVIQGDILTGKQIGLKNNTLNIYTTEGGGVNVQGSKGAISATSSDGKIATATCQNEETKSVQVKAHAVGNTFITVTDAKGNSQRFTVVVKDVEELWSQKKCQHCKRYQTMCSNRCNTGRLCRYCSPCHCKRQRLQIRIQNTFIHSVW